MSRGLFATRLRRDVRREGVDGGGDQGDDHFDEPHGRVVDDGEDEDDDDEDGDDEKEIEKDGNDDSDDNDEGEETARMNMTTMMTITTMTSTAVTMDVSCGRAWAWFFVWWPDGCLWCPTCSRGQKSFVYWHGFTYVFRSLKRGTESGPHFWKQTVGPPSGCPPFAA